MALTAQPYAEKVKKGRPPAIVAHVQIEMGSEGSRWRSGLQGFGHDRKQKIAGDD